MSKFEDTKDSNFICTNCSLCTYALSGNQLVFQSIYVCETCNIIDSGICCCLGCSATCHYGHDIRFLAFGKSYCDCGASGCKLHLESISTAAFALKNSTSKEFLINLETPVLAQNIIKSFSIRENANILENIKNQSLNLITKSKNTFWLAANSAPRCPIEFLVKQIFEFHTQNMSIKNNTSECGSEWWIQVKELSKCSTSGESVAIDLHYDKDEEIASLFSVGVFPLISTVTYLCNETANPQPTIIFSNLASDPVGKNISLCAISYPRFGKHISFDGRLLHGAPSHLSLRQLPVSNYVHDSNITALDSLRVTLLVNIWIGHHPAGLQELPLSLIEVLENEKNNGDLGKDMQSPMNSTSWNINIEPILAHPFITITSDDLDKEEEEEEEEEEEDDDEEVEEEEEEEESNNNISLIKPSSTRKIFGEETMKIVNSNEEDVRKGTWLTLPFVSDDSIWGKEEDEAGLRLAMWLPSKNIIKKKIIDRSRVVHSAISNYDMSTLVIEYADDDCASYLMNEEDEVEEEMEEEISETLDQGIVNMSVS